MDRIYLLRHAQDKEKEHGFVEGTGQIIGSFAEFISEQNKDQKVGIVSSPSQRAYRTAEWIGKQISKGENGITLGIPAEAFTTEPYRNHQYAEGVIPHFALCDFLGQSFSITGVRGLPQVTDWVANNGLNNEYKNGNAIVKKTHEDFLSHIESFSHPNKDLLQVDDWTKELKEQLDERVSQAYEKVRAGCEEKVREHLQKYCNPGHEFEPVYNLAEELGEHLDALIMVTHLEFMRSIPRGYEKKGFNVESTNKSKNLEGVAIDVQNKTIRGMGSHLKYEAK